MSQNTTEGYNCVNGSWLIDLKKTSDILVATGGIKWHEPILQVINMIQDAHETQLTAHTVPTESAHG